MMLTVICCTAAALLIVFGFVYGRQVMKKRQYALKYEDIIRAESELNDLDTYFVSALIYTESSFRPEARSAAGAVGLMQIMPKTGEWLAEMEGIDFSEEWLTVPEYNIHLGCAYLKYLFERFPGCEEVLAAYNAGPNRVYEWIDDGLVLAGTGRLDVSRIPFGETKNYVNKAMNAYEMYKELYKAVLD